MKIIKNQIEAQYAYTSFYFELFLVLFALILIKRQAHQQP